MPFSPGGDVYADPSLPAQQASKPALNVLEAGVLPVRIIGFNRTDGEIVHDPGQIVGLTDTASYLMYSHREAANW